MNMAVFSPETEKVSTYTGLTIMGLLLGIYGAAVLIYSYDFPFYDDYMAVLEPVYHWLRLETLSSKIASLFQQHNEHRIVYVRLLSLSDYYLRGSIHFTDLIYWGNISLFLTFALIAQGVDFLRGARKIWALLPVVCLLFQFQSWDNTFWAMAAAQNFGIYLWVALALFGACRKGIVADAGTVAATLLAIGTSGSGLFLVPVVVALWAVQRRYRMVLLGGAVMMTAVFFYFNNYRRPVGYPSLSQTISEADWLQLALFGGAFLGSNFYHPAVSWVAPLAGGAGIAWFGWLTYRKYFQKNPYLYGFLAFLMLAALAVSLNRYGRGIEGAYPSRYRISSSLFLGITYLTMVQVAAPNWKKWVIGAGLIAGMGLYTVSAVVYLPRIQNNRELRIADNWLYHHGLPIAGSYRLKDANLMLKESVKSGLFRPQAVADAVFAPVDMKQYAEHKSIAGDTALAHPDVEYDVDLFKPIGNQTVVQGWIRFKQPGILLKEVIIAVNDRTGYTTLFQKRYDLFEKYHNIQYQDTGFLGVIPRSEEGVAGNNWYILAIGSNGRQVWLPPK